MKPRGAGWGSDLYEYIYESLMFDDEIDEPWWYTGTAAWRGRERVGGMVERPGGVSYRRSITTSPRGHPHAVRAPSVRDNSLVISLARGGPLPGGQLLIGSASLTYYVP